MHEAKRRRDCEKAKELHARTDDQHEQWKCQRDSDDKEQRGRYAIPPAPDLHGLEPRAAAQDGRIVEAYTDALIDDRDHQQEEHYEGTERHRRLKIGRLQRDEIVDPGRVDPDSVRLAQDTLHLEGFEALDESGERAREDRRREDRQRYLAEDGEWLGAA